MLVVSTESSWPISSEILNQAFSQCWRKHQISSRTTVMIETASFWMKTATRLHISKCLSSLEFSSVIPSARRAAWISNWLHHCGSKSWVRSQMKLTWIQLTRSHGKHSSLCVRMLKITEINLRMLQTSTSPSVKVRSPFVRTEKVVRSTRKTWKSLWHSRQSTFSTRRTSNLNG